MPEQLGNCDEAEAASKPFEEQGKRCKHRFSIVLWNGLPTAIDRIMEEHDAAGSDARGETVRHPTCVVFAPVFGIHTPGDDLVAEPQGIEARRQALGTVRRTKQPLTVGCDGSFTGIKLFPSFGSRLRRERRVIPRVVADRMARGSSLLYELGVLLSCLADHEKGRLRLISLQNVKHARCVFGMRPVVKSESGNRVLSRHARNGSRNILPSARPLTRYSRSRVMKNPEPVAQSHGLSFNTPASQTNLSNTRIGVTKSDHATLAHLTSRLARYCQAEPFGFA